MPSSEFAGENNVGTDGQRLGALQQLEQAAHPNVQWNPDQLKMATDAIDKMKSDITECVSLLLKAHGPHATITEMVDYAIMHDRLQKPED